MGNPTGHGGTSSHRSVSCSGMQNRRNNSRSVSPDGNSAVGTGWSRGTLGSIDVLGP